MAEHSFAFRSRLPGTTQDEVWRRISSWAGVNDELAPLVKMSHPASMPNIDDVPADGTSHFTSTLLLFGLIPFDAHRVAFREMRPPHVFDECSSSLVMRRWSHRRSLEELGDAVEVCDEVGFECRLPGLGALLEPVYRAVFAGRHRRLRRHFASRVSPDPMPPPPNA